MAVRARVIVLAGLRGVSTGWQAGLGVRLANSNILEGMKSLVPDGGGGVGRVHNRVVWMVPPSPSSWRLPGLVARYSERWSGC